MYDREIVLGCLRDILHALETVAARSSAVQAAGNLVADEAGREKLDAICMQLIAVGEALKQIDKMTQGALLPSNKGIEWDKAPPPHGRGGPETRRRDGAGMNPASRISIAGHRGLVGSAIHRNLSPPFFEAERPEYVFLAAARVGGIKRRFHEVGEGLTPS